MLPILNTLDNIKDSKAYLDECSYFIGLADLYKIHSTCHYNESMIYCPVQIEIINGDIKKSYGEAKFLLQVWEKGGKKVYQKALQAFNYLIYKPSDQDDKSDNLYIVDLKDPEIIFKVKDFANDPSCKISFTKLIVKYLTYNQNLLYRASESQIKVAEIILDSKNEDPIEVQDEDIFTINLENEILIGQSIPCRLLGLYLTVYKEGEVSLITAIETVQCQVDFSFLNVTKSSSVNEDESRFSYSLLQYREVIEKEALKHSTNDRIVKFDAIIREKTNFVVACALRESGSFDIYSNAYLVSTSPKDIFVEDFDISYDTVYLKMKTDYQKEEILIETGTGKKKKQQKKTIDVIKPVPQPQERVRGIHHYWENKMNYENSEFDPQYTLKNIFHKRIKNYCNLFNSFNLIGTVLAVAHGQMISIYSIINKKWIKHFIFEQEITSIFRSAQGKNAQITVLLNDGKLRVIRADKKPKVIVEKNDGDQEQWIEVNDDEINYSQNLTLPPGKVAQFTFDREDNKYVFFMITNGPQTTLILLYNNKLFDVTSQIKNFEDFDNQKTNIFFLFSISEISEFLIQIGQKIYLYTIEMIEEKQEDSKASENQSDEIEEIFLENIISKNLKPIIKLKKSLKIEELRTKLIFGIRFQVKQVEDDIVDDDEHKDKSSDREIEKKKDYEKEDHCFFILGDHQNIFKIHIKSGSTTIFPNQNCVGMYFSDNNYMYTLAQRSDQKKAGFRLYDIENVIEHNKDLSYNLSTSVQVGCQGFIDYSVSNQRIVFLANYENIEVVPILHRNTVAFIGMKPRRNYLATKVLNGQFYALSIKGQLYSWDLMTGKPKAVYYQNNKFSDYEIYSWCKDDLTYKKEWFDKILLRKKTPISMNLFQNYGKNNYHQIKNQISYIDKLPKQFYEFKLIEIQESGVKEHFQFIHPFFNGVMQYMFFSQDLRTMYLRLKYERQFLFRRIDLEIADDIKKVEWIEAHRFNHLPLDLMNITQYPFVFSPNFTKYIDIDNSRTHFVIRSVNKQEDILAKIPEQLISSKDESLVSQAARFKWIDENRFKIINIEGIERIVDISDYKFREVEFNFIPLYNPKICKERHYILDPPSLSTSNTLERLQRKYQAYKSAYYLHGVDDKQINGEVSPYSLNKSLFTVDYRIDDCIGDFVSDLSFSFLHWNLIEQLENGRLLVEQIDKEQVELLFYNILPKGNTILHSLHNQGDLMEKLMQIAHPNQEDRTKIDIHVPILQNYDRKSPIHLCSDSEEYRYINMFLQYLQGYGIDHHSRAINDELYTMVEHDLPNFIPYLESRVKQTEKIAKITKGTLKSTNKNHVCASSLWTTQEDISQLLVAAPIEQDLKLSFLDVPQIHSFVAENAENFFQALSETENMKFFETHAVKKLIEFKWPLIFQYTVVKLFIPFVCFLGLYLTYIHGLMYFEDRRQLTDSKFIATLLSIFAIYLLGIESYQFYKSGMRYFSSFWNYLDFGPPIMILVFIYMTYVDNFFDDRENENVLTTEATLQATMSLMIWLKFLYFLRIFKATSYLIRIIIEVIIDMRHFLLVLLLTFVAFGDAIYNINTSNHPDNNFIGGENIFYGVAYVYRMVLGDFDTQEQFGKVAVPMMWILFILCTVFNMIIMLNLLIAIISESFTRINEDKEQAGYQERAKFISENLYLVPMSRRIEYCQENRYLLFAVDQEQEKEEYQLTMDQKLKDLKEAIKSNNQKIAKKLEKKIKKNNKVLYKKFKAFVKAQFKDRKDQE